MPLAIWAGYCERLAILALILAGLYAACKHLRKMGLLTRRGHCIHVLETAALSPHAAIHLVQVAKRYFLIGSGPVTRLTELDVEVAELPDFVPGRFDEVDLPVRSER